jgi:hypothetical protein
MRVLPSKLANATLINAAMTSVMSALDMAEYASFDMVSFFISIDETGIPINSKSGIKPTIDHS